jgi:hypothetical protein
MNKKLIILILCVLSCVSSINAKNVKQILLRDGMVLQGTAGTLIGPDSNDTWFFELNSPVSDKGLVIDAGTRLQLLPSSAMELMIENAKTHLPGMYQIWNAKVTKYKGKNYLFISIFIPVNPPARPEPLKKDDVQNQSSSDANDVLFLPPDVREKLNAAQEEISKTGLRIPESNIVTIDNVQQEIEKRKRLNTDTVLLDKIVFFSQRDKEGFEFVLDSIGRNIDKTSFRLLPCEVLEETQAKQAASPEPLRFKVSGIVTKYKGNDYLLLYKASQIYSHGNFPR